MRNFDKDDNSDNNYARKKDDFYLSFCSFNYDCETVFNVPKIIKNISDFLSRKRRTILTIKVEDYLFPFYKFILRNFI